MNQPKAEQELRRVTGLSNASHEAAAPRLLPEHSVAFQTRRAHLAFSRLLEARLSKHQLKVGYWYYLRALGIKDRVSQKDLSDATNVTETTTGALLRGMAQEGLVERTKDTADKRQTLISLTSLGREVEQSISPYAVQLNDIATTGIRQQDLETCLAVLSRMAENLEVTFANASEGA